MLNKLSKDIAEMLLEEGLITPKQLEKAIEEQKKKQGKSGKNYNKSRLCQ